MNNEYLWFIKDYKNPQISLLKQWDKLFINDFESKIKWLYSEKKKKFYSKINYETSINRYEFILFKNDYITILSDKKNLKQINDIEFKEDLPF